MQYDVFISYSRKDSEVANRIFDTLSSAGISCFIDLDGISGGADFPTVLANAIMESKLMLLVASKNFYASEYAMKEVTFAVNNKGSHFILPVIIEKSELPKNLEFILSNINWRELSRSYRIERELLADVKDKLANPHAGETLVEQNKQKTKIINRLIIGSLSFIMLLLMVLIIPAQIENNKQNRERSAAVSASQECMRRLNNADILLQKLDSLRGDMEIKEDPFYKELAILDETEACVSKVDSILAIYSLQPSFSYLFNGISTRANNINRTLTTQRDSMANAMKTIAFSWYNDVYLESMDSLDYAIAQEYVKKATLLNPQDTVLSNIQELLSRP